MKYEYNFTNFHLPKKEYDKLRKISHFRSVKYTTRFENLLSVNMIEFIHFNTDEIGQHIPIKTDCRITEKGRCYLQYCKNNFVDIKIPIIISVIALVVSVFSLFAS